jgi:hypothetical protein
VEFSRAIVMPSAPVIGLVLFLDPLLGSAARLRVVEVA